jgi:rubredoxin
MKKYICANCGYVYDPQTGDPMNDIPPNTAFEDLPPEWVCPMCYVGKEMFDPMD